MRAPSREQIDTTKGIVEIRALTRKEANELQKISRQLRTAEAEQRADLEEKSEAVLAGCIVAGGDLVDDIEAGEYIHIMNRISFMSREYKEKN